MDMILDLQLSGVFLLISYLFLFDMIPFNWKGTNLGVTVSMVKVWGPAAT